MENQNITDYFRSNIFQSISAYTAWKMIVYSRSESMVSKGMAQKYVEVQNYHKDFFSMSERAFLVQFIVSVLHSFDKRDDSVSLFKVNERKTQEFIENNQEVISKLKKARNKIFAHKDLVITSVDLPSVNNLDDFFKKLIDLYNELTKGVDDSFTIFDNAYNIKYDIETLFLNLYRGEVIRKNEIDIKWMWEKDNKKASDIL